MWSDVAYTNPVVSSPPLPPSVILSPLFTVYSHRVPFIVYNYSDVDDTATRWSNIKYLEHRIGRESYHTEVSETNHFMYARKRRNSKSNYNEWNVPVDHEAITFQEFLTTAQQDHNKTLNERRHLYFRVSQNAGKLGSHNHNNFDKSNWLYDELPFFYPDNKKGNLIIKDIKSLRGIHCRFGMRSVIAEAHYDGSRNAIVQLRGLRRWVLVSPDQCNNMYLYPQGHPSARHSSVDWSNPDYEKFPKFKEMKANEVILQPGDVVYLPTYWFHYIVSLNINAQCNTRSGMTETYLQYIQKCGFNSPGKASIRRNRNRGIWS
jgi:hypothetical protein